MRNRWLLSDLLPVGSIVAELASGTLIFSAARPRNLVVMADDALIRPSPNASTIAHIRVVTRKELRIYAQRGALEFSYHGENEVIAEGAAYRVLLDPSEKEAAVTWESEQAGKSHKPPQIPLFDDWHCCGSRNPRADARAREPGQTGTAAQVQKSLMLACRRVRESL
jgi:hypothetical protein